MAWHLPIPPETRFIDPIQDATKAIVDQVVAEENRYYASMFGPGMPLEGMQDQFEIEVFPPEFYTSSDNFNPDCVNFGIRTKFRIKPRRKVESEA